MRLATQKACQYPLFCLTLCINSLSVLQSQPRSTASLLVTITINICIMYHTILWIEYCWPGDSKTHLRLVNTRKHRPQIQNFPTRKYISLVLLPSQICPAYHKHVAAPLSLPPLYVRRIPLSLSLFAQLLYVIHLCIACTSLRSILWDARIRCDYYTCSRI